MALSIVALIMAGGAGSRLAPMTDHRAKPAVPYAGVYRLVDFPLTNCAHSGISDVWVLQQSQPHALNSHLSGGRPWDLDRTYGGLQVLFPHQGEGESGWHQGNADAIYRNRSLLRDFDPDIVIVLSADHVYKLDYRSVVETHLERDAAVTMVTTRAPHDEVGRFGNVEVDDEGRVKEFRYKPDTPLSDLVTTEVFAFAARPLLDALDELASRQNADDEDAELSDFGDDLLPLLIERGRAFEHRFDAYWRDVGTPESYWRSHMDLLGPDPLLDLDDPDWPVLTAGTTRPPARLYGSASVDSAMVSPGCEIRGRVTGSVLAPGVVVEQGAEVHASVLLHGTVVEVGAVVSGAICDMHVRIGSGATVGQAPDDADQAGADDLVVLGEGAQIPPGSKLAPGARHSSDEIAASKDS